MKKYTISVSHCFCVHNLYITPATVILVNVKSVSLWASLYQAVNKKWCGRIGRSFCMWMG